MKVKEELELRKKVFLDYINNNIKDEMMQSSIKFVFINCFKEKITKECQSRNKVRLFILWYMLAFQVKSMSIHQLNWRLACNLYNVDYFAIIGEIKKIVSGESESLTIKAMEERFIVRRGADGLRDYKQIVIDLFYSISVNEELKSLANVREMNKYIYLLINEFSINFLDLTEDLKFNENYTNAISNMPINSKYQHMIQKEYTLLNKNTIAKANFNCRTQNKFLKILFKSYLDVVFKMDNAPHIRELKLFIYYFTKSAGDILINNFKQFNFELFKKQYYFLAKVQLELKKQENILLTYRLVTFYRFLINYYSENYVGHLFNDMYETIFLGTSVKRIIEENYIPLYYNRTEVTPKIDKFCIIPSQYTMHNAAQANYNLYVDVEDLDISIRKDIKEYIWCCNRKLKNKVSGLMVIKDFLEAKKDYDEYIFGKETINEHTYIIDEDFLYIYRGILEDKYIKNNSLKYALKEISTYLTYNSEKYNLTKNSLGALSLKGLNEFNGGTPITDNDLKVIYQEFKRREKIDKGKRIYTIVFEIFIQYCFRIGEIVSLERGCITDRENTISYLRKTSEKNYVDEKVPNEIISLIMEARELTEGILDDSLLSKYIFIEESTTNYSKRIKKLDFYREFKKVIIEVSDKLENKSYKPYNIRHTYIHNAFKEGIEHDLSLLEITSIVGVTYKTATKFYRDLNDVEAYVETLSKVIISDVITFGEVLLHENHESKRPVKYNLGNCKSEDCISDLGECLMCPYFQTFVNRIPAFESRIRFLNEELENDQDFAEKRRLNIEKKLLAKFLYDMCMLKKEGEINNK